MKSKGKSQGMGSLPIATDDDVSSDEWFARYLLDAVLLIVLVLTATALVGGVRPSSSGMDPTEAWRAVEGRDFSGSQYDERASAPDDSSFSPPSGLGLPGLAIPGRGTNSR
jgi:hypothetical protein